MILPSVQMKLKKERSNEIEEKLEQAEIDEQKKLQKEEKYRE